MSYRSLLPSAFVTLGLLITAALINGQEAAPPSVDLYENEPSPTPTQPPNGPELPELKQLDQNFKPPSLGAQGDESKLHLEWRQLKNRTVNDPEVQAAKKYAQAARTDLEKRNRLRDYYNVYYQRMSVLATNADLKGALERYKVMHQVSLLQPRVRPSPTPENASPTPTATPGKQKKSKNKHKDKAKLHLSDALPPAPDIVFLQASRFEARSSSG